MDGCIYWINFRLADALPQEKLRVWKEECDAWLKHHPKPWIESVWKKYDERFGDRLERWLDAGLGSRALARPDVREAVKECLMRFDGERLRVHSVVIMPTHVHLLLEPLRDNKLPLLLKGIKGASARRANQILGTSGQFWLDESYDHIVRSEEQYGHFLRYIAENPVKAHLRPDEYWHYYNGDTDILVCDPKGEAGIPACAEGNTGIPACGLFSEPTDTNVCATMMKPTDTNVCATMIKPTDTNVCATMMKPTDTNVCATMMKPTDTNVCATMMKPTDKNVCATLGHEMEVKGGRPNQNRPSDPNEVSDAERRDSDQPGRFLFARMTGRKGGRQDLLRKDRRPERPET